MYTESLEDYWLDFILVNITYIASYFHRNIKGGAFAGLSWCLCLVFCLFAFWDSDYFSFQNWFIYQSNKGFRDLLYPVLHPFALGNYTLFRFYIWGAALLLYAKTAQRFGICKNSAVFFFAFFFLMTFSYARASLGMAFYFLGISYILIKKESSLRRYIICAACFFMAFAAHRSMIVLILFTPCMLLPVNKRNVIIALCALPVLSGIMPYIFEYLASNGDQSDSLQEVYSSAEGYSNYQLAVTFNWKFMLTTQLRNWSFYTAMALAVYICIKKYKTKTTISKDITRLTALTFCVMYLAVLLFISGKGTNYGYYIMGYRFLYATGIPLCILLALSKKYDIMPKKYYRIPLILYFIYSEGFLLGKIVGLGVI